MCSFKSQIIIVRLIGRNVERSNPWPNLTEQTEGKIHSEESMKPAEIRIAILLNASRNATVGANLFGTIRVAFIHQLIHQ